MRNLLFALLVALLFIGAQDAWAQGDVGSQECGAAQDACYDAIDSDDFKNHGKKVSACAKASNTEAGFDITDECHSCIVSQVARRIPVVEQETCGPTIAPACQEIIDAGELRIFTSGIRNVTSGNLGFCDTNQINTSPDWQGPGWYQYTGDAGIQMPETPPSTSSCGTAAPGWLNGAHPTVEEGEVSRQVCFHWVGNTCHWNLNINIINCGDFFIYELPDVTDAFFCNGTYCGED